MLRRRTFDNDAATAGAGARTLFAGTEDGCIRSYKYPLTGAVLVISVVRSLLVSLQPSLQMTDQQQAECHGTLGLLAAMSFTTPCAGEQQDLRCAAGSITRLQLSHDDSMLFAAAADGCFFVFDVRDRDTTRLSKGCALVAAHCSVSDNRSVERLLSCHGVRQIPTSHVSTASQPPSAPRMEGVLGLLTVRSRDAVEVPM